MYLGVARTILERKGETMNQYELIADKVKREVEREIDRTIQVSYRKSRTKSGVAFPDEYRMISPQPTDIRRLATYLHELGHFIFKVKPSCMNELKAIQFSEQKLSENGIKIPREVRRHNKWYAAYSLAQALNRGMKNIPAELKPYKKYLHASNSYTHYGDGRPTKVDIRYMADISKC